MEHRINLDANAGLMPHPQHVARVLEKIKGALNPSSLHRPGQRARALVEEAREAVREFIAAQRGDKIIFTSGATEANSLALYGSNVLQTSSIVSTSIEHHSVLEVLHDLNARGLDVKLAKVTPFGIDLDNLAAQISSTTKFLSVMAANNETGIILPVAKIAELARNVAPKIIVHSDAVQLFGRAKTSIDLLKADLISLSGHKLGAFAGVGCLVAREHVDLTPQVRGGPQEGRMRAGTENLIGIVSMGEAVRELSPKLDQLIAKMRTGRDQLWHEIEKRCPKVERLFNEATTLPNTLSLRFPGSRSDDLLVALDLKGISVSAGSACASGKPEPSHVLLAHQLSHAQAKEVIRISLSGDELPEELVRAAEQIAQCNAANER